METLEKAVENYKGNNLVFLDVIQHPSKKGQPLGPIPGDGLVIDHLRRGIAHTMYHALGLYDKKYQVFTGTGLRSKKVEVKEMIKEQSGNLHLTDGLVNRVIALSPKATFNVIKGGKLVAKVKAILCKNDKCRTREFSDRVEPAIFYVDNSQLKCRHCDTPYDDDFEGRDKYILNLQGNRKLDQSESRLKERLQELADEHVMTMDDYSFKIAKAKENLPEDRRNEDCTEVELNEKEQEYISKVKSLIFDIHECMLYSLVFLDYGRERKVKTEKFGATMNKVRERLGLDGYASARLTTPVLDYTVAALFEVGELELTLKPGAEERKDEVFNGYKANFEPTDLLVSNMLKIIDEKSRR